MAAAPSRARKPSPPDGPVVLRDPRAIKALAHPARLAVIDEFFAGRRLTATECAEIAGLSASAMSYHLRALEKWGIIRRSEATGDGRERPWEAAGDRLAVDSAEPRASAAGEAVLVARLLDRQRAETLNWYSNQDEMSSGWYDSVTISSGVYSLTAEETKLLAEEVAAVAARFEARTTADATPDTRRVRLTFTVVPTREDVEGQDPAS
ncbi:MAG: winged helix-turn-helix domain-containing protein [Actinomycetota bacterium]|nr:winged helix-turn-helix domain-containing protein [Actinomycetota bacterium]MDQ2958468.1 winged helix-turn-helix domain-containing protein [Actinomycetota bacterium]